MGLLKLVELPLDDVIQQWGQYPEPGTRFVVAGTEYESVMVNLSIVYAIPVT